MIWKKFVPDSQEKAENTKRRDYLSKLQVLRKMRNKSSKDTETYTYLTEEIKSIEENLIVNQTTSQLSPRANALIHMGMMLVSCCTAWISRSPRPYELWRTFTDFLKTSSLAWILFYDKDEGCKNYDPTNPNGCNVYKKKTESECMHCAAMSAEKKVRGLDYTQKDVVDRPTAYVQPLARYLVENNRKLPVWFEELNSSVQGALARFLNLSLNNLKNGNFNMEFNPKGHWEITEKTPMSLFEQRQRHLETQHSQSAKELYDSSAEEEEKFVSAERIENQAGGLDSEEVSPAIEFEEKEVTYKGENLTVKIPVAKPFIVENAVEKMPTSDPGSHVSWLDTILSKIPFYGTWSLPLYFLIGMGLIALGYYLLNRKEDDECDNESNVMSDKVLTDRCQYDQMGQKCKIVNCTFTHALKDPEVKNEGRGVQNRQRRKAEKEAQDKSHTDRNKGERDAQAEIKAEQKKRKEDEELTLAGVGRKLKKRFFFGYGDQDYLKGILQNGGAVELKYFDHGELKFATVRTNDELKDYQKKYTNVTLIVSKASNGKNSKFVTQQTSDWDSTMRALSQGKFFPTSQMENLYEQLSDGTIIDVNKSLDKYLSHYHYNAAKKGYEYKENPVNETEHVHKFLKAKKTTEVKDPKKPLTWADKNKFSALASVEEVETEAEVTDDKLEYGKVKIAQLIGPKIKPETGSLKKVKKEMSVADIEKCAKELDRLLPHCKNEARTVEDADSILEMNTVGTVYIKHKATGVQVGSGRFVSNWVSTSRHIFQKERDGDAEYNLADLSCICDGYEFEPCKVDLCNTDDFAKLSLNPADLAVVLKNAKLAQIKTKSPNPHTNIWGLYPTENGLKVMPGKILEIRENLDGSIMLVHNINTKRSCSGMHIVDRYGATVAIHKGAISTGRNIAVAVTPQIAIAMKSNGPMPKNFWRQPRL